MRYRRLDASGVEALIGRGFARGAAPGEGPAYRGGHVGIVGGVRFARIERRRLVSEIYALELLTDV